MADLTPSAERELHDTNRPAWLEYVAPRMAQRLREIDRDSTLADAWGFLQRDYQHAVWALLDAAMRQRIRDARRRMVVDVSAPTHLPIPNCPQPDQGNAGEASA